MACEIIIPIKLGRISSLTQPTRDPFLIAQMDDSTIAVTVAFFPYIRNSEGPSEQKKDTSLKKEPWNWACWPSLVGKMIVFRLGKHLHDLWRKGKHQKYCKQQKTEGKTARHWWKKAVVHGVKPLTP